MYYSPPQEWTLGIEKARLIFLHLYSPFMLSQMTMNMCILQNFEKQNLGNKVKFTGTFKK